MFKDELITLILAMILILNANYKILKKFSDLIHTTRDLLLCDYSRRLSAEILAGEKNLTAAALHFKNKFPLSKTEISKKLEDLKSILSLKESKILRRQDFHAVCQKFKIEPKEQDTAHDKIVNWFIHYRYLGGF